MRQNIDPSLRHDVPEPTKATTLAKKDSVVNPKVTKHRANANLLSINKEVDTNGRALEDSNSRVTNINALVKTFKTKLVRPLSKLKTLSPANYQDNNGFMESQPNQYDDDCIDPFELSYEEESPDVQWADQENPPFQPDSRHRAQPPSKLPLFKLGSKLGSKQHPQMATPSLSVTCLQCNGSFISNSVLHRHLQSCKPQAAGDLLSQVEANFVDPMPVIKSAAQRDNQPSYAFRSLRFATATIGLNALSNLITCCLDTSCGMTLIDSKLAASLKATERFAPIIINGIGSAHRSRE
ncbi:hypothetical protein PENDEC_c014G03249 [Penicillium decumbens]|uniref:Uncharacterized protein n=1 Tax=Penicillium decumbens TaxID=69771 RepID=A0A1V6PAK7_PENDC|nr:hypothetical protein PENDEC_c014G03249 [Penicillium decumbens]